MIKNLFNCFKKETPKQIPEEPIIKKYNVLHDTLAYFILNNIEIYDVSQTKNSFNISFYYKRMKFLLYYQDNYISLIGEQFFFGAEALRLLKLSDIIPSINQKIESLLEAEIKEHNKKITELSIMEAESI